ncbi:MAG TPA: hypothetical protein VK689_12110 [Armatimonadota bacterium]|nr:hypothetical protein [Armatimonadota bacterium]
MKRFWISGGGQRIAEGVMFSDGFCVAVDYTREGCRVMSNSLDELEAAFCGDGVATLAIEGD